MSKFPFIYPLNFLLFTFDNSPVRFEQISRHLGLEYLSSGYGNSEENYTDNESNSDQIDRNLSSNGSYRDQSTSSCSSYDANGNFNGSSSSSNGRSSSSNGRSSSSNGSSSSSNGSSSSSNGSSSSSNGSSSRIVKKEKDVDDTKDDTGITEYWRSNGKGKEFDMEKVKDSVENKRRFDEDNDEDEREEEEEEEENGQCSREDERSEGGENKHEKTGISIPIEEENEAGKKADEGEKRVGETAKRARGRIAKELKKERKKEKKRIARKEREILQNEVIQARRNEQIRLNMHKNVRNSPNLSSSGGSFVNPEVEVEFEIAFDEREVLRGIVYIDGMGDIVDCYSPLPKCQVRKG